MDALEILKSDHERVSSLFDQLELAQEAKERRELFRQIRQELELHTFIEETVFYPFFAEREGFQDMIQGAYDEHQEIKDLLQELEQTADESEREGKLDELMACVEQHVRDEEEDLFPRVEKALDTVQLMQIASQLEEARNSMPAAA